MQDRVYQMPIRDITDLRQLLWNSLSQSIVDDATVLLMNVWTDFRPVWIKTDIETRAATKLELGLVMQTNWVLF